MPKPTAKPRRDYIRVTDFKVVDFDVVEPIDAVQAKASGGKLERTRHIVLLYAKGEDGIVYEFANGKWIGMPILIPESGDAQHAQRLLFPELSSADSGGATTNPKATTTNGGSV